jgi:phage tail protein X
MSKTYTTALGDMWDLIAQRTLGSEAHTDALIRANVQHRHIYIFPANVKLKIPEVAVKPPAGLPPWKRGGTA